MGRQKCTIKWQDKCLRLNARQKCTFKLQGKSVRLNGKRKVYV